MADKNRPDCAQFTYRTTKDGKLFVYWQGKNVRTYKGMEAANIVDEINSADRTERPHVYDFRTAIRAMAA